MRWEVDEHVAADTVSELAVDVAAKHPEQALQLVEQLLAEARAALLHLLTGMGNTWLADSISGLPLPSTPEEHITQGWRIHDWMWASVRVRPAPTGPTDLFAMALIVHGEEASGRRGKARTISIPWRLMVALEGERQALERRQQETRAGKQQHAEALGRSTGEALGLRGMLRRLAAITGAPPPRLERKAVLDVPT